MPSSTIHLLTAYKYNPNASVEFFAGSVVPDAVNDREDKDRTHLRDIDESQRMSALNSLAQKYDLSSDVFFGALLHMYADYAWDVTLQKRYIADFGEGWFLPYRQEIAVAGAWIYHHNADIRRIWDLLADSNLKIDVGAMTCGEFRKNCHKKCGDECGNAREFILRNRRWNRDNYTGESSAFISGEVEAFAITTADNFGKLF